MFYHVQVTQTIDLEPRHFGPGLKRVLFEKLVEKVEGTCSAKHGYIICVTSLADVSQGKLRQDGSGLATFRVSYDAVAMRPFRGEVVDAVVTSVNKMGFFAEAGPIQVFVSNHLIPEDYEYSSAGDAAFVSPDQSVRVEERCDVRVRVVGVRVDAAEMFCIASMKEPYLGVIT